MNFFEHQDTARRNTRRLVILMLLAVISLIAITTVLVAVLLYHYEYARGAAPGASAESNVIVLSFQTLSWEILAYITLVIGAVVALGSTYKLLQLSGGGPTVAEAMGGRLINIDTRDADERKILNVVEEMAIASGTPVPPVYLLEEAGINAFAAGFRPQDAVIGITRGCIRLLSREELQGVIAHEFSHILHGDMRLNIRLVGILHGILVIGLIGYFLMRHAQFSAISSSRRRGGGNVFPIIILGLGLIVIGYAGTFFGNIIKSAVSRQREFLADASAVQFTRNPAGIGGALKKIGGYSSGSMLQAAQAAQFSHMFFGRGIKSHFLSVMATHPPLEERIRRIEPGWDGSFPATDQIASTPTAAPETAASSGDARAAGFAAAVAGTAIDSIGQPAAEHVVEAGKLLREIPGDLLEAVHDPFAARAVIYGLLINKAPEAGREAQREQLRKGAHPAVAKMSVDMEAAIAELDPACHLPLLELCVPALKSLSAPQYQVFRRNLVALIRSDEKVDLFEWALYRIIVHSTGNKEPAKRMRPLKSLSDECQLLMSLLAHSGHDNPREAEAAYHAGFARLDLGSRFFMDRAAIGLPDLDRAIDHLQDLKALQKPLLLKALASCISHDARITIMEKELFRAIAICLDCPVPPLLDGQELA